MATATISSDVTLIDLLRQRDGATISELAQMMGVTATAVRQRLARLMDQGLVDRESVRQGRGRPVHRYGLTAEGRRQCGANFADLAIALWEEIRAIEDPTVRRGLLQRIARRLARDYASRIGEGDLAGRMRRLCELFGDRQVPFTVDESGRLPVLTAQACPYPDLAEWDRTICAMEKMLFSELLGENVRLSECRLDGAGCCTFELAGHSEV